MASPRSYYDHAGITIYHGDCREILPEIGPVDLVLTDPPYGIDKAEWDHEFCTDWLVFMPNLTSVLAVMPGVWNLLKMPERVESLTFRWMLIAHIVNGMTRGAIGFGNYIPCLVYSDEATTVYTKASDIKDICVGREAKPNHPSPKPITAMRWFIERLPGATILDPFMGSGTTLRAAKDLGRKAIGIEIEERYCEIAARRMSQEVFDFTKGKS